MLKSLRKKYNLRQHQLAALLGVNRSFIALIETQQRKMPAWILVELKKVFGDPFVANL